MLFGLPWVAIVAIVVPLAGLLFAYKEKELKLEEKRYTSAKESHELRKMILSLKNRIENLEAIVAEQEEDLKGEISLDEIEINESQGSQSKQKPKVSN